MPQKHNWKCAQPVSPQDTGWFEVKMEVNQLDYLPRLKYEERGSCYVCVSHCKDQLGYVRIKHKGKTELAHRVVYVLDYDESIKTKDRSCPSLEALEEESRINALYPKSAKIVWCPNGLGEDEYEDGCEAVEVMHLGQLYYKHTGD